MSASAEIVAGLRAVQSGLEHDAAALAQLVYEDLRQVAAQALARERPGHTLQPTALVHEAYLALAGAQGVDWRGRTHYRAVASRCVRRILVDHARRRGADRRDGGKRLTLDEGAVAGSKAVDWIELDDALTALARTSVRAAEIVELRFFGGLTEPEIALALGTSERTVRREWTAARAWLRRLLRPAD